MSVNYLNTSVDILASSFQVLEELGSKSQGGSFGVVYKAIEKESGTIVAIKHIDLESSEDDIQEIQQEISVLSSCASPFVTQYYGSFVRGFKLWIIMEYLSGGSCLDLLRPGSFTEAHIAIVMRELLLGLEYLHREGKIHRDIKAANILLSGTGQVKLADFGVATQLNNIKSQRNTFVGTPFWMAPEVISQVNPYSFKADIWSLGITAMELGLGEPPHAKIHPMKVLFLIPKEPAPRLEGNHWSREFKDFVEKCLVKNPDQRAGAKELLNHRFIRNAGRVEKLQELIERRQNWQTSRGSRKSHPRLYEETMNTLGAAPEEGWDFDTIRTNPHPPTLHPDHYKSTIRSRSTTSERSVSSALQGLNLNAAPQSGTTETQGRKVSDTAIRTNNGKRRRSSTAKKPTEKPTLEQKSQKAIKPEAHKQENPLTPVTDYGKAASTVRQFKRVPDKSPRTSPYGSLQAQNPKVEDENKVAMRSPTTEEGFMGRQLYSSVVRDTLAEIEERASQSGNQSAQEAVSCLAGAWSQLDAIDPESGYQLIRTLIDRLQQPQLHSMISPIPIVKTPELATRTNTKSSLSGPTLTGSSPVPKALTRPRRANSAGSNKKKRNLRRSDEFGIEGVDDEFDKPTPANSQLADVLYGRWLEGLRGRWGTGAK